MQQDRAQAASTLSGLPANNNSGVKPAVLPSDLNGDKRAIKHNLQTFIKACYCSCEVEVNLLFFGLTISAVSGGACGVIDDPILFRLSIPLKATGD